MSSTGIIVLAFNEVEALSQTIEEIRRHLLGRNFQIIISTSKKATHECQARAVLLSELHKEVSVYFQKMPFVGAAVIEAVLELNTDYIVYMSADGETPARLCSNLIDEIEQGDADIISASRWITGGSFAHYGIFKWILSASAQLLCKFVYLSKLTEFTYGFRIYRHEILKTCLFKERKHPFFLESLLVPIRLGYIVREIPVKWVPRTEGVSVVNFLTLLGYLIPVFRVRLSRKEKLRV